MKHLSLLVLIPALALARQAEEYKSIHQVESEAHSNDPVTLTETPSPVIPLLPKTSGASLLAKKVYGWHPYWAAGDAYLQYDYNALSHIAYFSYETDTATGGYTTVRDWQKTPLIGYAHGHGVKVTLTVTNFGSAKNEELLGDTLKQANMINTLISLLKSRSGDGVNFDLESIPAARRADLVSFMRHAVTRIKAELPEAEISMATPSVDWSNAWDFAQLSQICDYLIVMGYAYYYGGSSTAGPVAPLEGENYNITRTVDTYLTTGGVPPKKLLLGVPWYGYDWPVASNVRKSATTGAGSSRTYIVAEPMAALYGKTFDQTTKVPWFSYQSGGSWRQVWYDDSTSLAMKYGLVNARSLGGIGIWALSYDGGRAEIWNGIESAFLPMSVETIAGEVPREIELLQNYPNPFNPSTAISYRLSSPGSVRLKVFDLLGRTVATLVDGVRSAGAYTIRWDGRNDRGEGVCSGMYVCVMTTQKQIRNMKMLLLR